MFGLSGVIRKSLSVFILTVFVTSVVVTDAFAAMAGLPQPGTMVPMSNDYSFAVLKGIKIDVNNPFDLDFVIDSNSQKDVTEEEASKLVNYFLAALTIDKENIWVNLSPYEQNRITDKNLAITDLGKDLLKQDYILKQLSASLTHPTSTTGKNYWTRVNSEESVVNSGDLSKIWVVPETAKIYEEDNSAFITKMTFDVETQSEENISSSLVSILDEVRSDVNTGKNFANLRQIFHSIVLAEWFKAKLKDSIFKHYINQNKVAGIDINDKAVKDKIWAQYVESFKKGAYDTVAKVKDSNSGRIQKQKYFCGGIASAILALDPSATKGQRKIIGEATHMSINMRNYDGEAFKQSSSIVFPFTPTARKLKELNTATDLDKLLDAYVDLIKMEKISVLRDRLGNGKQLMREKSNILAEISSDFHLAYFDFANRPRDEQKLLFKNKKIFDFYINDYFKLLNRFAREFKYAFRFLPLDIQHNLKSFSFELLDTLERSYIYFLKYYFGGEKKFNLEKFNAFVRSLTADNMKEKILEKALPIMQDRIEHFQISKQEIAWLKELGYDYTLHVDKNSNAYHALQIKLYLEGNPYINSEMAHNIAIMISETDNLKLDMAAIESIYQASLDTVTEEYTVEIDNPAYEFQFDPWAQGINPSVDPDIPEKVGYKSSLSTTSFSLEQFEKELSRYVSVKNSDAALKVVDKINNDGWLPQTELDSQLIYDLLYEGQMDPRDITPLLAKIIAGELKNEIIAPVAQLYFDIRLDPKGQQGFLDWMQFSRLLDETEYYVERNEEFTVVPASDSKLWRVTKKTSDSVQDLIDKQSSAVMFINDLTVSGRALNALRKPKTNVDKFIESLKIALSDYKTKEKALVLINKTMPRLPEVALALRNYQIIHREIDILNMIELVDLDFLKKILSVENPDFVRQIAQEFLRFYDLNKTLTVYFFKNVLDEKELIDANEKYLAAKELLKTVPANEIKIKHINEAAPTVKAKGRFEVKYQSGEVTIRHLNLKEIAELEAKEEFARNVDTGLSVIGLFNTQKHKELVKGLLETSTKENINMKFTALLELTNKVPKEEITIAHINEAYDILANGGRFYVFYTAPYTQQDIIGYEESVEADQSIQLDHSGSNPHSKTARELYPDADWTDYNKPIYGETRKYDASITIRELSANEVAELELQEEFEYKVYNMLRTINFSTDKLDSLAQELIKISTDADIDLKFTAVEQLAKTVELKDIKIEHINQGYEILAKGAKFKIEYTPSSSKEGQTGTKDAEPELIYSSGWGGSSDLGSTIDLSRMNPGGEADQVPVYGTIKTPASVKIIELSTDEVEGDKLSSNVLIDGGIDAKGLNIETDALSSSSIEFKNFDPIGFKGFSFVITKFEKRDAKTLLASL